MLKITITAPQQADQTDRQIKLLLPLLLSRVCRVPEPQSLRRSEPLARFDSYMPGKVTALAVSWSTHLPAA